MTQVIDLTPIPVAVEPAKKPIEFKYYIEKNIIGQGAGAPKLNIYDADWKPKQYERIYLLSRGVISGLDLMRAETNSSHILYLGHFNDGVVE